MSNISGWIKLHRQLREGSFYKNSTAVHCWIECLLRASHTEKGTYAKRQKVVLKPGQFLMGREEFGDSIGISGSTAMFWIRQFKLDSMVDIKTSSVGTVVTILKWKDYQGLDSDVDSGKTADEQRMNTYKNVKNEKNNTSGISSPDIANLKTELAKKMGGGISHKFQDDAFRAASYLSIDFTARPDLKGRWLSFFKTVEPRVQNTISYLVDYPPFMAIQDPEHRMLYFFEVYKK